MQFCFKVQPVPLPNYMKRSKQQIHIFSLQEFAFYYKQTDCYQIQGWKQGSLIYVLSSDSTFPGSDTSSYSSARRPNDHVQIMLATKLLFSHSLNAILKALLPGI